MDELLSEKEQIDKMRDWWSEYGLVVIGGIVMGAALLFGVNYYQNARLEAQYAASSLYNTLADHVVEGRLEEAEAVAAELNTEHTDSAYAAQGKLAMARLYMDQNRDQDAADVLSAMLASSGADALKHVARVRLSKILLYQNKPDEVLALLDSVEGDAFAARYAEARGDAHFAKGDFDAARESYVLALTDAGQTIDQPLVQLKLLDLPVTPTETIGALETNVDGAETEATTNDAADPETSESEDAE